MVACSARPILQTPLRRKLARFAPKVTVMTPHQLLQHFDNGQLWPSRLDPQLDVAKAYRTALDTRSLRIQRGEHPVGFKIGFTNRTIWPVYQVFAPIWGTVWNTTLQDAEESNQISLASSCQPRLEPEVVFGMKSQPPKQASMSELFAAIDWIAPGFEVVQCHLPDWKFRAAETVADGSLHARLLVGPRQAVSEVASDAQGLIEQLSAMPATLFREGQPIDQGVGANVLDSPLHALMHFLQELRLCPGAPDLIAGDVVTTGTLTDAHAVQAGEHWRATFGSVLPDLNIVFK